MRSLHGGKASASASSCAEARRRTDEIWHEEEHILRVRLLRGKIERDCWVDEVHDNAAAPVLDRITSPLLGRVRGHGVYDGKMKKEEDLKEGRRGRSERVERCASGCELGLRREGTSRAAQPTLRASRNSRQPGAPFGIYSSLIVVERMYIDSSTSTNISYVQPMRNSIIKSNVHLPTALLVYGTHYSCTLLLLVDDLCDDDSDHDGDNGEENEREPEADPAHLSCPTSVDDGLVGLLHTVWSVRSGGGLRRLG